jgi:processive 1,2-diacylglycerol beta-glucosyltransferase
MSLQKERPGGPRVLIVSASVGAGHNQAAGAIADCLRRDFPQARVEVVDILTFAPWAFRTYYAGGYALAVSRFPRLYGLGFRLNDRPQTARRAPRERLRLWHERRHLRRFARYVVEDPPDLIVHTHFLGAPLLGRLIRSGGLPTPQMLVVTDIRMHRFWYSEGVCRWFAPAEPVAERLRQWGIEPQRITVSGMPVHPKWTAPLDRRRILADWSLPADRPIVLLSAGAEFTCGPVGRIARGILATCDDVFLAVLAGRNKKLLARLSRLPEAGRSLAGIAFTDRVHELVAACSLMVTKAGGLSTAECLAKATPMVLLPPVPGQEAGNAAYLAAHGAAVLARNARDVADHVARLLTDRGELARLAENARRLHRPAAQTIVAAIREETEIQQGCRGCRGSRES